MPPGSSDALSIADSPAPLAPTRRDDAALFCIGLAMRLIVLIVVLGAMHVSFHDYVRKGDGESYLLIAEAMRGRVDLASLEAYHHRVFLGYPALMAAVNLLGVSVAVAGLSITFVAAAFVPVLAGRFFDDWRIGWASLSLVPHWVINSSLVMTEAPTLALSLLGLVLAKKQKWIAAGVAMGVAGLLRPMACFATIGLLVALFLQRRMRPGLFVGAIALATFALGTAAGAMWKGSLLDNARIYRNDPRAYGGELFAPPFTSLIRETLSGHRPVGYSIYIWVHVAVVLIAIGLLVRIWRRTRAMTDTTALVWLVCNTAFSLCIGSYWGYQHFPRFGILAQPAILAGWRSALPNRRIFWIALAAAVTVFAGFGVKASP